MVKKIFLLAAMNFLAVSLCFPQQWAGNLKQYEKYLLARKYDSALYHAEESAALARGVTGENNLQYCKLLRNLAIAQYYLGNYRKSKFYILKEVVTRESLRAVNDPDYIDCLDAASVICRKEGSYEDALAQIKKAESKVLRLYGSSSARYARILENFAGIYHDYGFSDNDEVFIKQEKKYLGLATSVYSQLNGDEAALLLNINKANLAVWYNNTGNFSGAETLMGEVISFFQRTKGNRHPGYATAMNNLGVIYYGMGNYKLAEKNFVEALNTLKKSKGTDAFYTASVLCNLGALYHEIGNFRNAEIVLREAEELLKGASLDESPCYSVLLNNIAASYLSNEYYESIEKKNRQKFNDAGVLLNRAEAVFSLNCRSPHPRYNSIISNLAIWHNLIGDKRKSFEMLKDLALDANMSLKVVAMTNKMSYTGYMPGLPAEFSEIPEPSLITANVNLMAQVTASNSAVNVSVESGDALSIALIRMIMGRAERMKKEVGEYHPAYASTLKSLIVTYSIFEDFKREEELWLEYMRVMNHKTLQDFSYMSESEKEMYYHTKLPEVHSFLSYALSRKRENPAITIQAYNNILLSKGLMLKSSTAMRQAILNSNNPGLLNRYDEWISLKKEISALYSTPVEMRSKNINDLENKANEMERFLVSESQDFSDYRKTLQVTWETVRKNLKPGEAAIEFTDFIRREKDGGNEATYCALIVRNDSQYPEMIKLFTENQLRALIERPSYTPYIIGEIYGTKEKPNGKLYDLIWRPLEQYLKGITTVYISPSGLLNKVSFPSLSSSREVYLCDNYRINTTISTGLISGVTAATEKSKPTALIYGGISYTTGNPDFEVWPYLDGTKSEGDMISKILTSAQYEVKYLSGKDATEAYFKENAGKYNIQHLATHGFFFEDPDRKRFEEAQRNIQFGNIPFRGITRSLGVENFVNNENPLMRSGLVLAGANDVWADTISRNPEDGVLTAQEASQIDMRNCDLIVLSACETGLGDIKGSEGVYGLQRALKIAGARFIVMSLWEIPDRETVEFMSVFYKNITETKEIRNAFHTARETLRAKYDPYYWASFVLLE